MAFRPSVLPSIRAERRHDTTPQSSRFMVPVADSFPRARNSLSLSLSLSFGRSVGLGEATNDRTGNK